MRCWAAYLVAVACVAAGGAHPPVGANLARGRPYTLSPRPNYRHCTDPADGTQLTDGVQAKGYFWTQKETVGWSGGRTAYVTIDLGQPRAIGGMAFRTAAGVAGVQWPGELFVFVSDDAKSWYPAGDLVALSARKAKPPMEKYATHTFRADELATHGRHVKLAATPTGPYLFVDEIEVLAGDPALLAAPRKAEPVASVEAHATARQLTALVKAQLRRDLAAVREDIGQLADEDKAVMAGLAWLLEQQAEAMPLLSPKGFRAVLPMHELEREIFRLQAKVWQKQGKPALRLWKTHRWDPLAPTQEPAPGAPSPTIDVRMMLGEHRADVVNVTNAGERDKRLRVRLLGLPGGPRPDYVSVHEVQCVGTRHFTAVSAALPVARREGDAWIVTVPAGMTRQIWLSFHPRTLRPGGHEGMLELDDGLPRRLSVPVRLHVYPLRFPESTTLLLGGWSYTNADRMYGVTPQNRAAVVKLLREHHVNAPWATRAALPTGTFDAEGKLAEKPDTANFDAWIKLWPGAKRYMVYVAVGDWGSVSSTFAGSRVGTPLFEAKVGNWIRFWASHMRQLGLKPGQLGLLLVDEPNRKEQYDVTIAWSRAIKKAEPEVIVWVDPCPREHKTCVEMMAEVDVLVPQRIQWLTKGWRFQALFRRQREAGRQLGLYSCSGPARTFDPYSYYLLQQWHVFAIGGQWAGFWAFADNGRASCWNEYVAQGNGPYCPLYLDDTTVTTAKYLEAIREGVQDYEYLVMLRDSLTEPEKAPKPPPELVAANLRVPCTRVLEAPDATEYRWDKPKDRTVADTVRVEILDLLSMLRAE